MERKLWSWKDRNDLLDDVIRKGVVVAVRLIQNVECLYAKPRILAALFDKGEGRVIDDVLGGIKYGDVDLIGLAH